MEFERRGSRRKDKSFEPTQGGEIHIIARHSLDHRIDLVGETGELRNHPDSKCCHCSCVDSHRVPVEAGGFIQLANIVTTTPSD